VKSIHLLYCLLAACPFILGGCSSAGDIAWGEEAGGGGSPIATGAGAASGETVRTGSISTRLISGTVAVIARRQATERQRALATQRGRAWVARRPALTYTAHLGQHARYIAIDTERDSRTSPRAQQTVMLFDTEAQQVVGKNVYDVQTPPAVGSIARFETYSAQYVGPGL
jgi:hypothetical protein